MKGIKAMTEQEKIALIEETLDLDEGTLTADTVLDDVDEYDSMAKLSLIVMMDDEFGKKLTGDVIKGFKTVGDILAVMEK
jgi:acyl carrier protein